MTGQEPAPAKPVSVDATATFRNIVFPTDFSLCSQAALPYATAVAERYGAAVHVIHVAGSESGTYPVGEFCPVPDEPGEIAQEMDALTQSSLLKKIFFTRTIEQGDIWDAISKRVADTHADLIVVATHGHSGFTHLVLGSVAEKILRRAVCPVLTVGPEARKRGLARGRMDAVLCATDLSPASLPALDYAVALARAYYSELILLHVSSGTPNEFCDRQDVLEGTRRLLRDLMRKHPMVEYDVVVECGLAADTIITVAAERKADLIVMGAADSTSILDRPAWAIAYEVVSCASCPVLTVHA